MTEAECRQMLRRRAALERRMETTYTPIGKVRVPERVASSEWFRKSGLRKTLRTYALLAFMFQGFSGKIAAAFKILLEEGAAGNLRSRPIIVAATSGNFGYAMAMLTLSYRKLFEVGGFIAVVESTTSKGKLAHLRRSGAVVKIAPSGMTAIGYADQLGRQPGYFTINQYTHAGNVRAQRWPAMKIYRRFKDKLSVFVATVGSTASIVGVKQFLEPLLPDLKFVGVGSLSKKEKVPGSRPEEDLTVTGFGYKEALSYYRLVTSVTKHEAFEASQELIKDCYSVGPTSGLTVAGFFKLLEEECKAGRLDAMKNKDGKIVVVFLFMDMFLPYVEEYDEILGVLDEV